MNKVVEIEDYRAHLMIPAISGNAHVIPRSFMEKIASGAERITGLEKWEDIIPTIIREWLDEENTSSRVVSELILRGTDQEMSEIASRLDQDLKAGVSCFNIRQKDGSEFAVEIKISEI